jgi:uncharacterized NAD(P)/FAD-binding protein YdhS
MTSIAIVGAGFSGTLLALHLLRRCPPSTHVTLIERNNQFGLGTAYSTGNASHLLNVPAGRMSAFHDAPHDFVDWLKAEAELPPGAEPSDRAFVPRQLFGEYIRHHLNRELKRSQSKDRLDLVRGDVCAIDRVEDGFILRIASGKSVRADFVVLATGNFPPESPPIADKSFYDTDLYCSDPWEPDAFTCLAAADPVLLIGTGLTMVDAVISLLDRGHTGPIHAVSRRGLLPLRHALDAMAPSPSKRPLPTTVNALARHLREEGARALEEGATWQPVIDHMRPFTQDVWAAMSLDDRARFLRHLRPWWDIHRHRLAPAVAARIDGALTSGQLRTAAGRIRAFRWSGDGVPPGRVAIDYLSKRSRTLVTLEAARVINCSGPGCDYDRIQHPLIKSLLADGQVRPDALKLGLDVTGNCALKDRSAAISQRLFAIGPVTKGAFWEIIAVPDIRRQCELLSDYIAGLAKPAARPAPESSRSTASRITSVPAAS